MATLTTFAIVATTLTCLLVSIYKLTLRLLTYKHYLNRLEVFPSDKPIPIFGNIFQFPGTDEIGLAWQRDTTLRFPKLFLFRCLHFRAIFVHHPETVKIILKSSEPKGEQVYNIIRPWIGDGLLTSFGKKWSRNRRLLTPAFHFEILKNYIEVKNRCADCLLKKFAKISDTNQTIKVFEDVSMFTLDVIFRCSMSYHTNCQEVGDVHPYVKSVNEISELLVYRLLRPWLLFDWLYWLTPGGWKMRRHCQFVHKVANDIIVARKSRLEKEMSDDNKKKHKCLDFLDILLTSKDEDGNGLTDQEIRDEVDTFLFEGHDTTASAISWALYSIAEHPEIQEKIQTELDEKFMGRCSDDVMWEDLPELTYLTKVIKEALRLHTPVPFIQRTLTKDTEFDGKVVPAGTMVSVMLYNIHHNQDVWQDSLRFDPERFSLENIQKRDKFSFVPFSAGPRNCIGQTFAMDEIKVVLARLLLKFSIRLDPRHKVEKDESIVMRAKNDIKLLVNTRKS